MPATQESSAALSRCSLPAPRCSSPEPEQICGSRSASRPHPLLRYHVDPVGSFVTAADLRGSGSHTGGNAVDEHYPGHGGRLGGHLRQGRAAPGRGRSWWPSRCGVRAGVAVGASLGAGVGSCAGVSVGAGGFGRLRGWLCRWFPALVPRSVLDWFRGRFGVEKLRGGGPRSAPGQAASAPPLRAGAAPPPQRLRWPCPAAIQHAKSTANRRFFIGVFLLCTNSCAGGLSIAGIVLEYTGPPAQKASIAGIR